MLAAPREHATVVQRGALNPSTMFKTRIYLYLPLFISICFNIYPIASYLYLPLFISICVSIYLPLKKLDFEPKK